LSSFDSSLIHCDSGAGSPGRTTSAGDSGSSAEPSLTSAPAAPTALAADEVVARLEVPHPTPDEFLRAYKISKRYDDDISAVCLVVALQLEGDRVRAVRIGAGGVAATPARATLAEAALAGQPWTEAAARAAGAALQAQFQPISDMRASAGYRHQVLANLMQRLWLESQGAPGLNLEAPPSALTVMGLQDEVWNGSHHGVEGLA
jgi:CO/xanthine dehydrogenase FAD-binding subunit